MPWVDLDAELAELFDGLATADEGHPKIAAWMAMRRAKHLARVKAWQKTPHGRACKARLRKRHDAKVIDAALCQVCARPIAITRKMKRSGRGKLCSDRCKGARYSPPVTVAGRAMALSWWCRFFGVKPSTAKHRIARGWPPAIAVTQPPALAAQRAQKDEP